MRNNIYHFFIYIVCHLNIYSLSIASAVSTYFRYCMIRLTILQNQKLWISKGDWSDHDEYARYMTSPTINQSRMAVPFPKLKIAANTKLKRTWNSQLAPPLRMILSIEALIHSKSFRSKAPSLLCC